MAHQIKTSVCILCKRGHSPASRTPDYQLRETGCDPLIPLNPWIPLKFCQSSQEWPSWRKDPVHGQHGLFLDPGEHAICGENWTVALESVPPLSFVGGSLAIAIGFQRALVAGAARRWWGALPASSHGGRVSTSPMTNRLTRLHPLVFLTVKLLFCPL